MYIYIDILYYLPLYYYYLLLYIIIIISYHIQRYRLILQHFQIGLKLNIEWPRYHNCRLHKYIISIFK